MRDDSSRYKGHQDTFGYSYDAHGRKRTGWWDMEKRKNEMIDDSTIMIGPPKEGKELLERLERRLGLMKLIGERDDLLLDCAVFISNHITASDQPQGNGGRKK